MKGINLNNEKFKYTMLGNKQNKGKDYLVGMKEIQEKCKKIMIKKKNYDMSKWKNTSIGVDKIR